MATLDAYGEAGLAATFPYDAATVASVRRCLGFKWSKERRAWLAEGPEVLLDLERYRIPYRLTPRGEERERRFREQLDEIHAARTTETNGRAYGYQDVGTAVLTKQRNGLLADDMGLGKTKQAIDAAYALGSQAVLVLCPKTLTYNWLDELAKWRPEWTVALVPDVKRAEFWRTTSAHVWVANYEKVLLKDWPDVVPWDAVILDEVQRVKNGQTATHKKVRAIARRARHVFGLSGTPLEIRPTELHGVMSVIRPALFGDFFRFRNEYLLVDSWGQVLGFQPGKQELLKERLAPWMIRRRKDEVLALPDKLYNTAYVELSSVERAQYAELKRSFESWLREEGEGQEGQALVKLLRLQQFTSSPALLDWGKDAGSKYAALRELLDEWPGKAVVFTRFAEMAKLLCDWLETPYLIAGEVRAEERLATVKRFNESADARVLVSTDAGAYGLNITEADLVVHYDQLWNPGKMPQREDRLHRIGQTRRVNVVSLISKGTIDEGMVRATDRRRELPKDVIDGAEEVALRKLGIGSLRKLIEGRV